MLTSQLAGDLRDAGFQFRQSLLWTVMSAAAAATTLLASEGQGTSSEKT